MPKEYPDVDMRWGAVQCVGEEYLEREEVINNARERWHDRLYTIRCNCGREFKVWHNDWPGLSKHMDCGCGAWRAEVMPVEEEDLSEVRRPGRPRSTERKTMMQVYMSLDEYVELREVADEQNVSLSGLVRGLIRSLLDARGKKGD